MERFLIDVQHDTLAFIVLIALILSVITSLIFIYQTTPELLPKSKATCLLSLLTLLGFPAAWDLIKTNGITRFYAIFVFIILILALMVPILNYVQKFPSKFVSNWHIWSTPVLAIGGLVVASYLTYVEVTSVSAVCGVAIPGCVTVQTSSYAKLFGFVPVAALGVIGYLVIMAIWFIENNVNTPYKNLCGLGQWGICFFGVLFSIYLTYLEVYVIRATCTWCILSAVLMVLLLWASTSKAQTYFMKVNETNKQNSSLSG